MELWISVARLQYTLIEVYSVTILFAYRQTEREKKKRCKVVFLLVFFPQRALKRFPSLVKVSDSFLSHLPSHFLIVYWV